MSPPDDDAALTSTHLRHLEEYGGVVTLQLDPKGGTSHTVVMHGLWGQSARHIFNDDLVGTENESKVRMLELW